MSDLELSLAGSLMAPVPDVDYTSITEGRDRRGVAWEVGVLDGDLLVTIDTPGAWQLDLEGSERDRFAEAVARAATPAVRVKHGPDCRCTPCLAEPSYRDRRETAQAAGTED